ncbi:MAG: PSD1 and planctomycete cytochrome C domain-containing protein [Planctomycetaceae bacterium]
MRIGRSSLAVFLVALVTCRALVAANADELVYERDVRPILKAACFHCHGEGGQNEGGLDLRLVRLMQTGGDSGAAVVPGQSAESLLFQRVRDGEMPPEESHRLTALQTETIARWIDSGAKTARAEPASPDGFVATEEERAHWAYRPLLRPKVPAVQHRDRLRTPIDAFVLAKLEADGFQYSDEAPSATVVRRLKLDLLGLPPDHAELNALADSTAPDAYEQLVDDWLASPHYGERWGRHWLDVAGYADSEGYSVEDSRRLHAWRYRDYVVRSLNDDKPYDRFVLEQLAGDELITSPINNLTAADAELLAATGFLRMAPDGTGGTVDDAVVARNDVMADTLRIVSSSLLGMTVGCAQCHDHRYDPIPQTDYYQLRAIFEPAFNVAKWQSPRQRLISLYTDANRAAAAAVEVRAKEVDAERTRRQTEYINATFESELSKLPEEIRAAARLARDSAPKKRTSEQQQLLKTHPSLNVSAGSLYLYDKKAADQLKTLADQAKAIRAEKPPEYFVRAIRETPGTLPDTFLFSRGDPTQPKSEKLVPASLSIVSSVADVPEIPIDDPTLPTSGRRRAFAEQLTDRDHPLTARVLVNRIWMHHFGRGIVATPADFGALGTPPTHPELLDWLAVELIDSGWSLKHIQRLIVTSTVYRQTLRSNQDLIGHDPDNLLYGGARLRRLDAETLRDVMLATVGELNDELYGPPVPVIADNVGRWVLGIENLDAGRPGKVIPIGAEEFRRSLYVEARRSRPLAVLDTFDWPRMVPNCELRRSSTVAPQALMLLNRDFTLKSAGQFATHIIETTGLDAEQQIVTAWNLAYGRQPDPSETASARQFLTDQQTLFAAQAALLDDKARQAAPAPEQRALETLCQMLLSSNEYLYVD